MTRIVEKLRWRGRNTKVLSILGRGKRMCRVEKKLFAIAKTVDGKRKWCRFFYYASDFKRSLAHLSGWTHRTCIIIGYCVTRLVLDDKRAQRKIRREFLNSNTCFFTFFKTYCSADNIHDDHELIINNNY